MKNEMFNYLAEMKEIDLKIEKFKIQIDQIIKELESEFSNRNEMMHHRIVVKDDILFVPFMNNFLIYCGIKVYLDHKKPNYIFNIDITPKLNNLIYKPAESFYRNEIAPMRDKLLNNYFHGISAKFMI